MIFIRRHQPVVPPFYCYYTNFGPSYNYAAFHTPAHQVSPKEEEPQADEENMTDTKNNKDHEAAGTEMSDKTTKDRCTVINRYRDAQLVEEDDAYSISIDLPGVKASDVSIELEGNNLQLEAKRTTGSNVGSKKYTKRFLVNKKSVELSGITACLSDGVLTIKVPKKAPTEPLTIQIMPEYPPEESSNKRAFVTTLDVPGVKIDDLKVVFHDDIVEVRGERTRGRFASKIQRRFGADENKIDVCTLQAYLVDGVLTVTAALLKENSMKGKKSVLVTTGDNAAVPQKNEEVVMTKEED